MPPPAAKRQKRTKTLIESGVIEGDAKRQKRNNALIQNGEQKKKTEKLLGKAGKGDVKLMLDVGINYYFGEDGFDKDDEMAYFWIQKAHAAGNVKGTALLGGFLVRGHGVAKNERKGIAYMGLAANESNAAAFELGMAFANGEFGLPTDKEEACRMLERVVKGKCTHKHLAASLVEEAKEELKELNEQTKTSPQKVSCG